MSKNKILTFWPNNISIILFSLHVLCTADNYAYFIPERLCDSIYEYEHATVDDVLCKEIIKPKCVDKWKTLYDKTCKTTYTFDCNGPPLPNNGYGVHTLKAIQQVYRVKSNSAQSGGTQDSYTQNAYNKDPYNPREFKCRRKPNVRCYQTPRKVKVQKCEESKEQKCQKITNRNPRTVQRQTCHDEPYEECELEKQHQTKMVQVPTYVEECDSIPREICDNQGITTLELRCVEEPRPVCKWEPRQGKCRRNPRQHCYKVPYQEKTTDCNESYQGEMGNGNFGMPYGGNSGRPYGVNSRGEYGGNAGVPYNVPYGNK